MSQRHFSTLHVLAGLLSVLVFLGTTQAQDQVDPVASNKATNALISVAKLKLMLETQPKMRIIDVGPNREEYDDGHIPGALFVHWINDVIDPDQSERYNLIGSSKMQALMRRLGVSENDHIVFYDNLSSRLATRLYWSLRVYNHPHLYVLDGGRSKWISQGGMLSKDIPEITSSDYQIRRLNEEMSVDMTFVAAHLRDPKVTLIDGRPPKQFSGEELGRVFHTGTPHKLRGHIPGAEHVFWKDNFNEDGTFKSVDELKLLYEKAGVEAEKSDTVVTYCNEGLHAAPPWFVLRELLGVRDVRVYDDSMSEWANSGQPVEQSNPDKSNPPAEAKP
jgi:thiosulfate/3-mercaptopyruvate sulfurtransferase